MGTYRSLTAVLTTAALALSLSACTQSGPTPEDAAVTLAAGLAKLDVADVAFSGSSAADANTALQDAVGAMNPLKPEVTVGSVEETGDDTAIARLNVTWDIDGTDQDWTYSTSAELTRSKDEWTVDFSPAVLVDGLVPGAELARDNVPAERGDILGANGSPLVTDRPVVRVGIDKSRLEESQLASSAVALGKLLKLDAAAYAQQVAAAGPDAWVEALVLRDDNEREVTNEQIVVIPGSRAIEDTLELAPTRTFARATLGIVEQASAEMIQASNGELQAGDIAGISGLQAQYDQQLRGIPGVTITAVPPPTPKPSASAGTTKGNGVGTPEPRELFSTAPINGKPLATTLDPGLQKLAEGLLDPEESATSIVAIRPSTGEILTVANGPGSEGYNTSLLGQYPPGSTFKMATSLALLRDGFTPESPTECTEKITVDGATFRNAPTYPETALGTVPLRTTFANSCNTGFIAEHETVSQQSLSEAAAALGIGVETNVGLPAFFGSVPAEATGTAHAASMIGQGEVLVSPLALARAAASVGVGKRVSPTLLTADGGTQTSSSSSAGSTSTPSAEAAPEITEQEAQTLRSLMRSVVTDGGAALLADVPGEPVLAKTGTAEFGTEDPPKTHAWIAALQGDLAVAVFVEEGEYGSTSGGPLLKEFLRKAR